MYKFYYDESEHSRVLNYSTLKSRTYYDNFLVGIIGFDEKNEDKISNSYIEFENKYELRKRKGELKSLTMKTKDLECGFASLNKHTIAFYEDLLNFFNEDIIIYIASLSKLEIIIDQVFEKYRNIVCLDFDLMKYSLVKMINVYHPDNVLNAIYKDEKEFKKALKDFLIDRIEKNKDNINLKQKESNVCEEILYVLDEIGEVKSLDWNYTIAFDGFKKLTNEMNVKDFDFVIDKEGEEKQDSKTLEAARKVGFENAIEGNSKSYVGLRIADMLVGLIAKLMKSLRNSLKYNGDYLNKKLLEYKWFKLNERQINLYKKLYKIICENNNYWYKTYAGVYADDFILFISLLQYIVKNENLINLEDDKCALESEYFNTYANNALILHFDRIKNKLQIDFVNDEEEFVINSRGAKVYKDIRKQPILEIRDGNNEFDVLAVGMDSSGNPLATIKKDNKVVCYRIPDEYSEWALTMIGFSNMGIKFFPGKVNFSFQNGKYYVDLL